MQLLAIFGALATFATQAAATPTSPALFPRASPQPCSQRYVCPEPRPFDPVQFPDAGADPGPTRFKCRIGTSTSNPDFAFCIYEKDTGELVGATPSGIQPLCWSSAQPNPQCSNPSRRALPIRPRDAESQQPATPVVMERFTKAKKK